MNLKGVSLLLFAILLQMCSTGLEILTLVLGIGGLIITFLDRSKSNSYK